MSLPTKPRKGLQTLAALGLGATLVAALAWYYDTYVHWQPKVFPIAFAALTLGIAALSLLVFWARGERHKALLWKTGVSVAVFSGVILFGVSFLINNVIYKAKSPGPSIAAAVALPLAAAQIVVLYILLLRVLRKPAVIVGVAAIMLAAGLLCFGGPHYLRSYRAPAPVLAEGHFVPMPELGEVDFTVPIDGAIEEVRDLIRWARADGNDKHFTVLIEDGEYSIEHIEFDARDRDTTYRSRDGGVLLNGSTRLDPEDFTQWDKNESIKVIDLTKLGLSADDWGEFYAYGWASAARKYDNGVGPLPCELYVNGVRCTLARYPNGEDNFLKTGKVLDPGDTSDVRNPRGGTFQMDAKTARRAATWGDDSDIWMFGYFSYDWCDASTRVKSFDFSSGSLTTEHASAYEYNAGRHYYFFNILEELDAPGEWYLDRGTGLLYFWPPKGDFDNARIDLTLNTETLLEGDGASNLTFQGLTLQGTRGDGMRFTGDGVTVDHCLIRNLAGDALRLDGYNNSASDNEICFVGQRGIYLSGGDPETLTPGNSRAVNNLIHDWPTVAQTWLCGVELRGVGNLCAHNEFYNSAHTAIYFHGNNNVIEYNSIHDVVRHVSDSGAIYGEQHWEYRGNVIRCNAIYNLGSGEFRPVGIYLDDGRSGVAVENNLVVNAGQIGIQLGGGRDHTVTGNVVVNCERGISYDDRARRGALEGSQGNTALGSGSFWLPNEASGIWNSLWASPWRSEIWQEAYPALARMTDDPSDLDDPNFAPNPAYSVVRGNVLVGRRPTDFSEGARRFSTLGPNDEYSLWQGRKYWTLPGYENIPLEQIGRIGE